MDISNAINSLRQSQPPKPHPGFTQKSVDEAWQFLLEFLEQHHERIAALYATDAGEEATDSESPYKH